VIALALAVPALALPIAWRAPSAVAARAWTRWLALADAGLWLAVLVVDADASVGRFGAAGAPAAIGTWLLLASISWPARRLPIVLAVLAAGLSAGGAALLAGGGDLSDAGGALAIAAVVVVLAARSEQDRGLAPAALAAGGAAAVALGLVRLEADTGGFARGGGWLVLLGAAAVAVGAGARVRRTGVVLLPLALAVGAQAGAGAGASIALGAVAVLVAGHAAAALALWALAASAVSVPAALLVASAAVVVAAWRHPVAPLVALPGAAALAFAAAQDGAAVWVALALLGALTVARLWLADAHDVVDGVVSAPTIAAIGAGAWLLVAPETWRWADAPGLESWGTGALYAIGAAAAAAFALASFTGTSFAAPALEVADPAYRPGDPRWAARAALAAVAILAIAGGWLVASVLS
jgi:hypothetical protein